jgi:hypothetical protein
MKTHPIVEKETQLYTVSSQIFKCPCSIYRQNATHTADSELKIHLCRSFDHPAWVMNIISCRGLMAPIVRSLETNIEFTESEKE